MVLILHERLLNKLKQRKEELTNLLLLDNVDFANFRHITGKIKGIDESVEIIRGVFRGIDTEDDID